MGMIGLQTRTVAAPDGTSLVVRLALSVEECADAKQAALNKSLARGREVAKAAGYKGFDELQEAAGKRAIDAAPEEEPDPRDSYDLDFAAARLVKSWPYTDAEGDVVEINARHVGYLDRETREWLHDLTWQAMQEHLPDSDMGNI